MGREVRTGKVNRCAPAAKSYHSLGSNCSSTNNKNSTNGSKLEYWLFDVRCRRRTPPSIGTSPCQLLGDSQQSHDEKNIGHRFAEKTMNRFTLADTWRTTADDAQRDNPSLGHTERDRKKVLIRTKRQGNVIAMSTSVCMWNVSEP